MSCLALLFVCVTAGDAWADSTVTQTVPPGGTMRSSTDAQPTSANPVIVTVTNTRETPARPIPGDDGSQTITLTLTDRPGGSAGDNAEGPNGYEFVGPNVKIDSPTEGSALTLTFEVEGSLRLPGFLASRDQFLYHVVPKGQPASQTEGFNFMAQDFGAVTKTADGDYRLDLTKDVFFGSYDVLQPSFYAEAYSGGDDSFPDALRKGVSVLLKTDYRCSVDWTIKISSAVARKLKLKSTTIGEKSFGAPGGGVQRVPLTSAARRALRRYSRVAVTAMSVAKGPDGQVIRDKRAITLKTPESELG